MNKGKKKNFVFKFVSEIISGEFLEGATVGGLFTGKKIDIKTKKTKLVSSKNDRVLTQVSLSVGKAAAKSKIDIFGEVFETSKSASRFTEAARIAAGMCDVLLDAKLKTERTDDHLRVYALTLTPSVPRQITDGDLNVENFNLDYDEDEDEDDPEDCPTHRKRARKKKKVRCRSARDDDDDDEDEDDDDFDG